MRGSAYRTNRINSTAIVAGNYGGLGQVYANRVSIMAWVENGEETFFDANGDGLFNKGERFTDVGDPFIDHNEDGVYGGMLRFDEPAAGASTVGGACYDGSSSVCFQHGGENETYVDVNNNGVFDAVGNGIYNGPLCDIEGEGCTRQGVTIFKQLTILQAGSWAAIGVTRIGDDTYDSSNYLSYLDLAGTQTYRVAVSDYRNGYMPEGTDIEFDTTYGKIIGQSSCDVLNISALGHSVCYVTLEPLDDAGTGVFTITVTTPKGSETIRQLTVSKD